MITDLYINFCILVNGKKAFCNFTLKIKEPDNCCTLNNGDIVLIKNIASDNKNIVIIGMEININQKQIF